MTIGCSNKPGRPSLGAGGVVDRPKIDEESDDLIENDEDGDGKDDDFGDEGITQEKVPVDLTGQNAVFADVISKVRASSCAADSKMQPGTRIITRHEWVETVNAVLNLSLEEASFATNLPPSSAPPTNSAFSDYDHLRDYNKMSVERLQKYVKANKLVADQVVKDKGDSILNCGAGSAKACVSKWLSEKLPSLWKTPVSAADLAPHVAFFEKAGSDKLGLARLIERVLLSHQFLYRSQLGLSGQLTSWEVASSLADALWDAPVTGDLVALANADGLKTAADIEKQIQKMTADPKFYRGVKRFVRAWLRSSHLENKMFKPEQQISDKAKEQMIDESTNFLFYLIRNKQDTMDGIFKSKFTIAKQDLASVYNFQVESAIPEDMGMGKDLKKLTLPEGRFGIFGQPGLLIGLSSLEKTNIPRRGQEVMAQFMCQGLATPEGLVDAVKSVGATIDPNDSVVNFFDKVSKSSTVCSNCHNFINGVGFGLEEVGSTGKFRTLDDHMKPVVSDGALIGIEGYKTPYTGVSGLNTTMSTSLDFKACLTVQLFRYVNGRLETKKDSCSIASSLKKANSSTLTFSSIFSAILTDKGFINRKKAGE